MYQPIRGGFDETLRRQEWSRQPTFTPLDVPVDCHIMFSTLPDSKYVKSKLNTMLSTI